MKDKILFFFDMPKHKLLAMFVTLLVYGVTRLLGFTHFLYTLIFMDIVTSLYRAHMKESLIKRTAEALIDDEEVSNVQLGIPQDATRERRMEVLVEIATEKANDPEAKINSLSNAIVSGAICIMLLITSDILIMIAAQAILK